MIDLPPLPEPFGFIEPTGRSPAFHYMRRSNETGMPLFTAEQVRSAVLQERARVLSLVRDLTHPVAEFLYGHTREKAVEWAKEDKYDSDAYKADEILEIVAAAIRGQKE